LATFTSCLGSGFEIGFLIRGLAVVGLGVLTGSTLVTGLTTGFLTAVEGLVACPGMLYLHAAVAETLGFSLTSSVG
jgi:hypothetical protein